MKELLVFVSLLGNMTVTAYRSVPEQTDSTPLITSTGERVSKYGCAVSQDLLLSGRVKYGDWIYIEGVGLRVVNDTMAPRHKNHVDLWVQTYAEEKAIGVRKNQRVTKISLKEQ